jgi:hypothetical protein
MKKTILIFLTFSLVLTMAFASPLRILAAEEGNTVLVMKGREQTVDREIEINVVVEENSGVSGMLLSLEYDTSVFTLTDLVYGTAFSSLSPIHTNTETEQGYGIYPFMISYLGDENDTSTGTMMTLHFRVKENAPDGSYHITFKYERDKDVSYLKDGKILTKNLLIDGAEITLAADKVVKIETYPDDQRQADTEKKPIAVWVVGTVGASVIIVGCTVTVSVLVKRNKQKKWTKI